MDLYAYTQIVGLGKIAECNGISVPCCRGYRLMKIEQRVTAAEIEQMLKEVEERVETEITFKHVKIFLEKSVFPFERIFNILEVPQDKRQWYIEQLQDVPRPERNMVSWLDVQGD